MGSTRWKWQEVPKTMTWRRGKRTPIETFNEEIRLSLNRKKSLSVLHEKVHYEQVEETVR